MPLIKRHIEPLFISRGKTSEESMRNELEATCVRTLAGLIRQLSSLSKQAEDIFAEIYNDANNIINRTKTLDQRAKALEQKIKQECTEEDILKDSKCAQ